MVKAVIFDMYETLVTQYSGTLYFGEEIACDLGIEEDIFLPMWKKSKKARSIGEITFEEIIENSMRKYGVFSEEKLKMVVKKREHFELQAFSNVNEGIFPMLLALRAKGIKIGLISNCFSEEVYLIQQSALFELFDVTCLSFLEKCQKPDSKIYNLCLDRLQVSAWECLYVGDGKEELNKAKEMGMKSVQAMWYIGNHPDNESRRCQDFEMLETPLNIFEYL